MKSFIEFITEENAYEVGTSVKFDQIKLKSRVDDADMVAGGFDYGRIVDKNGNMYSLELPNGNIIKVMDTEIISYGNRSVTPE